MKVTVLLGGTSAERDVSLASGLRVAAALRTRGHAVTCVDTARGPLTPEQEEALQAAGVVKREPPSQAELLALQRETLPQMVRTLPLLADADVVFLGLHGGYGEDGSVQSLLNMAGIRYTGSGPLASGLAMDKDLSKRLFRNVGVPTADWCMVSRWDSRGIAVERDSQAMALGFPVVVKPSKQGSTVGLTVVKRGEELARAISLAAEYDDEIMLERFVAGRELTVGILGGDPLPVGEIIPKHEIYDYECKYTAGMAEEVFPASLSGAQGARLQELAVRAFRALKLRGYARIDFRMDEGGGGRAAVGETGGGAGGDKHDAEFYCLEANTLPGMTQTSLIPQAAAAAAISFPELCERIVQLALDEPTTMEE